MASQGGGSNGANDGDASSRMGMLQVNDLQYKLEPDMSVATSRTHTIQYFQNPEYSSTQTAIAVLNSGAHYIDPRRSFLSFNLELDDLKTGTPNDPWKRFWFQALYFGEHGSIANLIESVVVTTRSGDEISRVQDFGAMNNMILPWIFGSDYMKTMGDAMGFGSYIGTSNDVTQALDAAGNAYSKQYSEHYRKKFTIPMYLLAPPFNYGRLLPSMLMSGLRIEIKWKDLSGAGQQFLENVPIQLPLGLPHAHDRDLTFDRVPLARSLAVITPAASARLLPVSYPSFLANYGISSVWGVGGIGAATTYTGGIVDITSTILYTESIEANGRGARVPFEVGDGLELVELNTNFVHVFQVTAVPTNHTLAVRPLANSHMVLFADYTVVPATIGIAGGVGTISTAAHYGTTSMTHVRLGGVVYQAEYKTANTFTFIAPVPADAVASPIVAGDGIVRSTVPPLIYTAAEARVSVYRRYITPVSVTYQRILRGDDVYALGGAFKPDWATMTEFKIKDIEFSLAATQLSDAVQRTLNEYSSVSGLEIVFADYDRTSSPLNRGTEPQMIYLEVRKSASRALAAYARVVATPDAARRPYIDTFASMQGSAWRNYQWQLGSLYFPQQRVAAKDTDVYLQEDGTLALAYNYTADAFDRFHPKAAPTAVSLRGGGIDWNVIGRHPVSSIREHRPDAFFHPPGSFVYGKWGSFVNGATTIACTLERSSLFDLAGIPINNSRVLALRGEFRGNVTDAGTLLIFLKYVKVCRVFLLNAEVEQ